MRTLFATKQTLEAVAYLHNMNQLTFSFMAGAELSFYAASTLRWRKNGCHFAYDIFKCIFVNENVWILIKISLKYVPEGPIDNIPALVQIIAWRRPGDKPLSEPMIVNLLTHICVIRSQWFTYTAERMESPGSARPERDWFHCRKYQYWYITFQNYFLITQTRHIKLVDILLSCIKLCNRYRIQHVVKYEKFH